MYQLEQQSYKDRLEQSIKESQISGLPAAARAQLRETGNFVGSIPPSLNTSNYETKAMQIMKRVERSMDSKYRKGGTPSINTDIHNITQSYNVMMNNTSTHRRPENIKYQTNKQHTPSMRSDMNVTFNKGKSTKLSQTSKKSSLNKSTGLKGLFNNEIPSNVVTPPSLNNDKETKFQIYKGGTVPDKFGHPKKLNL